MRTDQGMTGVAVLWVLVAICALGMAALQIARSQKNRANFEAAEIQARLLIAASTLLARHDQFRFVEKTDRFETGLVRLVRVPDPDEARVTLRCAATVGNFTKNVSLAWKKSPNGWALAYWAEP